MSVGWLTNILSRGASFTTEQWMQCLTLTGFLVSGLGRTLYRERVQYRPRSLVALHYSRSGVKLHVYLREFL
ncbi:hypothetical protein M405DRAFT_637604 [Rhizopogon salebrosus TDB-379]|nr:hypothetical protein M405DRAFT_637604 [Rhizopogon salebrosus TDB-379]